jgi:hypothetical protein
MIENNYYGLNGEFTCSLLQLNNERDAMMTPSRRDRLWDEPIRSPSKLGQSLSTFNTKYFSSIYRRFKLPFIRHHHHHHHHQQMIGIRNLRFRMLPTAERTVYATQASRSFHQTPYGLVFLGVCMHLIGENAALLDAFARNIVHCPRLLCDFSGRLSPGERAQIFSISNELPVT